MAKEITISMADSQFESLQEAYAKDDDSVEKVAVEAVAQVLYTDDDDIPEGVEVGDVKVVAVDAVEAVVAVEAVEAQSKDTKASLLAAIASNA